MKFFMRMTFSRFRFVSEKRPVSTKYLRWQNYDFQLSFFLCVKSEIGRRWEIKSKEVVRSHKPMFCQSCHVTCNRWNCCENFSTDKRNETFYKCHKCDSACHWRCQLEAAALLKALLKARLKHVLKTFTPVNTFFAKPLLIDIAA